MKSRFGSVILALTLAAPLFAAGQRFVPITPCRLYDSRITGPSFSPSTAHRDIAAWGNCGVPSAAKVVSLNATAVLNANGGAGSFQLYPSGTAAPATNVVNFDPSNSPVGNNAYVPVGANGAIHVFRGGSGPGTADLILDVNGYFTDVQTSGSLGFRSLTTCRAYDSRTLNDPIAGGAIKTVGIATKCGIPTDAAAGSFNLTVVSSDGYGFVDMFSAGISWPQTSTINFKPGDLARTNGATTAFGQGSVSLILGGAHTAQFTVDTNGYYSDKAPLNYFPIAPCRLPSLPRLISGQPVNIQVEGNCGVPVGAAAAVLNFTSTNNDAAGHIYVYPSGQPVPGAVLTTLPPAPATVTIQSIQQLSTGVSDLTIRPFIANGGGTSVTVDVVGYFMASGGLVTQIQPLLQAEFQAGSCPNVSPAGLYYPTLYPLSGNRLGMITQGNCLGECNNSMSESDSLFRWERAPDGSWTAPTIAGGAMADFRGPHLVDSCTDPTICSCDGPTKQLTNYSGVFGEPAAVSMDGKIFLAYEKGNGDSWNGEVWWAVSADAGLTWSLLPQPLIVGANHRGHKSYGGCPEGFSGISMTTTTDNTGTYFHVYGTYFHPGRERNSPFALISYVDYRIRYDSSSLFGLGSTRELWYNGQYTASSGNLVWCYDSGGNCQPGGPGLDPSLVNSSWGSSGNFFTASVTRDASGYIMLVGSFGDGAYDPKPPLHIMHSADGVTWSAPATIDTTLVLRQYPAAKILNSGLYYGNLDGSPALWAFLAIGDRCDRHISPYDAVSILPVKIALTP
jgi:hypothetical protein